MRSLGRVRVSPLQAIDYGVPGPEHLTTRLGLIPETPAARDTWLRLALHIERRLDAGLAIERREGFSIAERLDRLGECEPPRSRPSDHRHRRSASFGGGS